MRLIETIPDLERLADRLAGESLIAADTEAAGYHRYSDSLCLVQLSTRSETWLVDTVALGSLNPIAELFADPGVETVFHDADYDLRLLDRDFGVHARGLFDTKIAARFAGERSFGLASLLEDELGLKLKKKYQRADWARRPLPEEMLEYAAMDTRYLPELRDRLRDRLEEMGRLGWAEEEFRIAERTGWEPPEDEDKAFLRIKGTRGLKPRNLAVLRELYEWRETEARERDVASFRVLTNNALIAVARALPRGARELAGLEGLSHGNARRWGDPLMAAVDRGMAVPDDELPRRERGPRRPPRDPELEARVDRLKAVRDRAAKELELDRGFLMPRSQLEDIARVRPRTPEELREIEGLRGWQMEALGDALMESLNGNSGQ
jgi:ribonuclease D